MRRRLFVASAALLPGIMGSMYATAAADMVVPDVEFSFEQGWIRTPPPGATMLAGYGILHNLGKIPLVVTAAESDWFGSVSLHESVEENHTTHMRSLDRLEVAPGASVKFAPGGKHLMLMQPKHELKAGARVFVTLLSADKRASTNLLVVGDGPPGPGKW